MQLRKKISVNLKTPQKPHGLLTHPVEKFNNYMAMLDMYSLRALLDSNITNWLTNRTVVDGGPAEDDSEIRQLIARNMQFRLIQKAKNGTLSSPKHFMNVEGDEPEILKQKMRRNGFSDLASTHAKKKRSPRRKKKEIEEDEFKLPQSLSRLEVFGNKDLPIDCIFPTPSQHHMFP